MLIRDHNLVIGRVLGRIVGIDNHEMTRLECDYKVVSQCLGPEGDTDQCLAAQCSAEEDGPTALCV